ncbi:ribonuclease HI [Thermaurantiacus sp.]
MPRVVIASDGACRGNPGPGGWAAILRAGAQEKIVSGADALTTNNRMELTAALRALQALNRPARVTIETDSRYLLDGMTKWLPAWKARGWRTADGKPVKNADLWAALVEAAAPHEVDWQWVRGHNGHEANERADRLANEALDRMLASARQGMSA